MEMEMEMKIANILKIEMDGFFAACSPHRTTKADDKPTSISQPRDSLAIGLQEIGQTPKEKWGKGPGGLDNRDNGQIHFFPAICNTEQLNKHPHVTSPMFRSSWRKGSRQRDTIPSNEIFVPHFITSKNKTS
eukprot:747950-Hanusia_phi.AAC.6